MILVGGKPLLVEILVNSIVISRCAAIGSIAISSRSGSFDLLRCAGKSFPGVPGCSQLGATFTASRYANFTGGKTALRCFKYTSNSSLFLSLEMPSILLAICFVPCFMKVTADK